MPLSPGFRLGPYEILDALGAGGMGEVYRARDTRLERTVAVKILPAHLSNDAVRKQRFEREAKTISSLNHPHICTLYDVGSQDGVAYLVMECLEGETLAKRLERGPLPLEQALKYGAQIADALNKAHGAGIVHRDLKPGNIILRATGAKLLDFGLAKPTAPLMNGATLTAAPAQAPVTQEGTIVGTVQYMSPEQIEGRDVDGRSDIFSLGAVLYEMVTGQRAFPGNSPLSVASAILEKEPPPVASLRPMTPPELDRVVRQCLAKDREERMQSAHDVKLQLDGIDERKPEGPGEERKGIWRAVVSAAAGLCVGAAIMYGVAATSFKSPLEQPVVRSLLLPPSGTWFKQYNFAVSPDGTRLVFVATGKDGQDSMWLRALSGTAAQPLEGTKGAMYPFWSPDSRKIGFFSEGALKVVEIASGTVRMLCEASVGRGGAWNQEGTIVFAPSIVGPLYRVGERGGTPVAVTEIARGGGAQGHRWPSFLPDGRHFLYFVDWSLPEDPQGNGIYVGSLDGGKPKLLSRELSGNVVYVNERLLYVRDRSLMAQRFDASRLEFDGEAVAVAQQETGKDMGFSQSGFSVSRNGILVFQSTTDTRSQLVWLDAQGKELGRIPENGLGEPRISPDGRFVAEASDDELNGKSYIRVHDLGRGIATRLTSGGEEVDPAWSRDGKHVVYASGFRTGTSLYQAVVDGSAPPELILTGARMGHLDLSKDGQILFSSWAKGLPELTAYSLADKKVTETGTRGAEGRLSPDGKWVACTGLGTGVFVVPFPGIGKHVQISKGNGSQPVWSRDGKKLFFIAPDKTLVSVSFDSGAGTAGTPQALFQTRIIGANFAGTQYDVAPDGRFLIHVLPAEYASPLTIVTDWPAAAKVK